ncbi:hypothetical protein ADUPG1_008593 [Aduncisulcus paluster]|uniref:Protein kinase domain-containing protein n=1 Tax=Aduncisulcus paluster TaxID=2918883 RepID=A0ABQ5KTR9_9EUKA|nr:hypothetical protein ADUPG1_008593 [Aduncisulcus paluster]
MSHPSDLESLSLDEISIVIEQAESVDCEKDNLFSESLPNLFPWIRAFSKQKIVSDKNKEIFIECCKYISIMMISEYDKDIYYPLSDSSMKKITKHLRTIKFHARCSGQSLVYFLRILRCCSEKLKQCKRDFYFYAREFLDQYIPLFLTSPELNKDLSIEVLELCKSLSLSSSNDSHTEYIRKELLDLWYTYIVTKHHNMEVCFSSERYKKLFIQFLANLPFSEKLIRQPLPVYHPHPHMAPKVFSIFESIVVLLPEILKNDKIIEYRPLLLVFAGGCYCQCETIFNLVKDYLDEWYDLFQKRSCSEGLQYWQILLSKLSYYAVLSTNTKICCQLKRYDEKMKKLCCPRNDYSVISAYKDYIKSIKERPQIPKAPSITRRKRGGPRESQDYSIHSSVSCGATSSLSRKECAEKIVEFLQIQGVLDEIRSLSTQVITTIPFKGLQLGKGGFGEVQLVEYEEQTYAYKMILKSSQDSGEISLTDIKNVVKEFNLQDKLWKNCHEKGSEYVPQTHYIVNCLVSGPSETLFTGSFGYLMDYCELGSVKKFGHSLKKKTLPEKHIALLKVFLSVGMIEALFRVREVDGHLYHRDIKLSNFLIKKVINSDGIHEYRVLLADFGLAKEQSTEKSEALTKMRKNPNLMADGTLAYIPPELILRGISSRDGDLYSLGMSIYAVFNEFQDDWYSFALKTKSGSKLDIVRDEMERLIERKDFPLFKLESLDHFAKLKENGFERIAKRLSDTFSKLICHIYRDRGSIKEAWENVKEFSTIILDGCQYNLTGVIDYFDKC